LSGDSERIERLVKMAERLIEAVEADIKALKACQPKAMRTTDPEVQRLSAIYGREAEGFNQSTIDGVPSPLRSRFIATTTKFRELLNLHARLIARVRNASEGMIRAIAEEVERQAAPTRTYTAGPSTRPRPTQAMVYNSVI
jgi:hypothetical protein